MNGHDNDEALEAELQLGASEDQRGIGSGDPNDDREFLMDQAPVEISESELDAEGEDVPEDEASGSH